jgi:AcrR family transcriptional regulator
MRTRLLDATVQCLLRGGYARTTTIEIARRARVSRGAQLHHFPTKAELVTAAVEHLFDRACAEFQHAFARLPAGASRAEAAIGLLWGFFTGPTFYAALELLVAARTDSALRRIVASVHRRFDETVARIFRSHFPGPADGAPFFAAVPAFVFSLMEGMALARIVESDDSRNEQILAMLRWLSPLVERPELMETTWNGLTSTSTA